DNFASSRQHEIDCFGVNAMFFLQNAGRKRFDRIVIQNRNHSLVDDWAIVQRAGYEVNRAAAEFYSVLQRLFLDLEPGKRRQQRRMNIQDTVGKGVEKDGAEDSHEPGKNHQANIVLL